MGAKFSLEANGQGGINLIRKLNQLLDESEKGFKKTAQGAGELERAAKRIVQQTEGPQERWNRKLAKNRARIDEFAATQRASKMRPFQPRRGRVDS